MFQNIFFFAKHAIFCDNVEKSGPSKQIADENITRSREDEIFMQVY